MVRVVKQAILPSIICFLLIKCKIIIKPDVGLCVHTVYYLSVWAKFTIYGFDCGRIHQCHWLNSQNYRNITHFSVLKHECRKGNT